MRTFHNLNEVPPGGFRYFCPHTGKWSEAFTSPHDMMIAMRHFYAANGWGDTPSEAEVLDQLCRLLELQGKGGCCKGNEVLPKQGRLEVSIQTIARGTKIYADWIKSGKKVPLSEANRRAEICSRCPWNVVSNECKGCGGKSRFAQLVGTVAQAVGGLENTAYHDRLHTCFACLCALQVKVHCPKEIIEENMTEEQRVKLWENCWLK